MRAVVQRVSRAAVRVGGEEVGAIGAGVLALIGVMRGDAERDATWLADKVLALRIFADGDGAMNRSLTEAGGSLLAVSQFTLAGDARRGRRPSFVEAAEPGEAERLYRVFVERARGAGARVAEGRFRAMMEVELVNDGPVTILLDSSKRF